MCAIVAITINYFYLVAFAWMVTEGVMLYLKVVKVFNVDTSTKIFYALAWGKKNLIISKKRLLFSDLFQLNVFFSSEIRLKHSNFLDISVKRSPQFKDTTLK